MPETQSIGPSHALMRWAMGFACLAVTSGASAQVTLTPLTTLPGGTMSMGTALNFDGSVIVGWSYSDSGPHACRWTTTGRPQDLGIFPGGRASQATAISADGTVIVGDSDATDGQHAFRWTAATGFQDIGRFSGGTFSEVLAISDNGAVIIGTTNTGNGTRGYRWTYATGLQPLSYLPAGTLSLVYSAGADGMWLTGFADSPSGLRTVHWRNSPPAIVDSGPLPSGSFPLMCQFAIDGVVNASFGGTANGRPQLWTPPLGTVDVANYLASRGADLTGWDVGRSIAISADGTTMIGMGQYLGESRGWVARGLPRILPSLCRVDLVSEGGIELPDGVVSVSDLVAFLGQFFAGNPTLADFGGVGGSVLRDGEITVDDLVYFVNAFFAGCP